MSRRQTAFRFPEDLLEALTASAERNFRPLSKEVEFRLRESLKTNPSGATNTLGTDQAIKAQDHEQNTSNPTTRRSSDN